MLFLEPTASSRCCRPTGSCAASATDGVAACCDGLRELFDVEPRGPATRCVARSRPPALAAGGEGRFGLWTRDGGALLTARRGAFDADPAGRRRRRVRAPRRDAARSRPWSASLGIDAAAIAAGAARATRGRRARRSTRSTRRRRRRRRVPAGAHAGRLDRGRRPGRRRHAPEVDLLLPEGPDRPRASTRTSGETGAHADDRPHDPPTASSRGPAASHGRPVRKDEIELHERGLYIESWLPERRSRRKPLLFVHGELAGSWVWERYLHYFAGRGWEGHALNLRNHFWSQTADPDTLDVETYTEDVVAAAERLGPSDGRRRPRDGRAARPQGGRARSPVSASCSSRPSCRASCATRPGRTAARGPRRLRALASSAGRRCPRSSSATTAT